ncbi:bifunctional (p)ppGpp synthetase/guanosine-3',5'-bis(diphosphate) 3'-pyrophosphohydrolase [Rhodoferax sp. 4810]|uniref:GTP pyrophosphokinase n=1 Tax=Thiospirillum jenense TaxID=1653858 RepID=A0A839HC21_9GAMM|nr:bifunctional (p)ppGpp synthetase/guanosine-3',5'-bis(diphosphate) 3'-pyrophosphohydrolase [Thiospirillum jenense]MBB1074292.1 bifunctional (p)ppGpp synthetase/guanosine-3',5'-bis(diphosphate) 3'-pyrophosphohydrolase [Rhodoferax jenense]MBB1126503.1 bifunctional (p)ppGpp synthetase/guanosine-3',5'-bis(diphosphate) 3'-pyrophosphohydrolase [Thiospirillum jenense]
MVQATYNLLGTEYDDATASRHWLTALAAHYTASDQSRIAIAVERMRHCYGNQQVSTGESAARHRLSTADILLELRMDADTLCAALLNGCLDCNDFSIATLRNQFGDGLAQMVQDLAYIDQLTNVNRVIATKDQQEHEENLRRLLLGIAEDVRVVLVVLAERLHVMRIAKQLTRERQIKLAEDTQRVYAPLANRLGIGQIKWELEDLVLRYLEPEEYKRIASYLRERRVQRQEYIARVVAILEAEFIRAGIEASISGRPKHIYSIWRKMQRKGIEFEQIFDLRALRVMVKDVPSCYAALGVVHSLWSHIPQEFDDYIATPKGNMYRSLHTAVIGPEDQAIEVQIRTYDMHRHAELGVAAHWAYKESKNHDAEFQRRVVWMRQWLELKNEGEHGEDFFEHFKTEFEPTHIYVLTPQAKVIELPKGATPLDFAYAIHSEVGHHCRGALVNGRMVALNYCLVSGETVEIITQNNMTPSRDWLNPHKGYMVTSRARHRVRQWFKLQDYDRHLNEGRSLLERELRGEQKLSLDKQLDRLANHYRLADGSAVLAALGRGDLRIEQLLHQFTTAPVNHSEPPVITRATPARCAYSIPSIQNNKLNNTMVVMVAGAIDMMTRMALCCNPQPHNSIIGFITRGRGVTIHRSDCKNIVNLPPHEQERLVEAHWTEVKKP